MLLLASYSYFEDAADDVDPADLMYLPAPDSPTRKVDDAAGKDSDDSDDPLDAFMQGIEVWLKTTRRIALNSFMFELHI